MPVAINAWTFPPERSPAQQLVAAASASFDGIELTIATDGPLCFDSPLEDCASLARQARDLNLQVVSLATAEVCRRLRNIINDRPILGRGDCP